MFGRVTRPSVSLGVTESVFLSAKRAAVACRPKEDAGMAAAVAYERQRRMINSNSTPIARYTAAMASAPHGERWNSSPLSR